MELIFLHPDKQSFLQVDFNTLGIKVSYKVILSLLIGMIKHSQSTRSKKFAMYCHKTWIAGKELEAPFQF